MEGMDCSILDAIVFIVIKPDQKIDPVKKLDPGLYRLIQIKLKKLKKNI
jgi:hypothetical protein